MDPTAGEVASPHFESVPVTRLPRMVMPRAMQKCERRSICYADGPLDRRFGHLQGDAPRPRPADEDNPARS